MTFHRKGHKQRHASHERLIVFYQRTSALWYKPNRAVVQGTPDIETIRTTYAKDFSMSRSALFSLLQRSLQLAHALNHTGLESEQVFDQRATLSRRQFLKASAATGTLLTLSPILTSCHGLRGGVSLEDQPARIAIIGAGMAGLHCAYRLRKAGLLARVYEASARVGGRMFSLRDHFADQQVAELGGEFIDSDHAAMIALAKELDVTLDEVPTFNPQNAAPELFFFRGKIVTEETIVRLFRPVARIMAACLARAEKDGDFFTRTDNTNIVQWLEHVAHADPLLGELLRVAYVEEYGLEAEEQSAFNLLYLIDYQSMPPFKVFGKSDERFHAHQGNDIFISRLAEKIGAQLQMNSRLVSLREIHGSFHLSIDRDGTIKDEHFDIVVFALPFTLLRQIELKVTLPPQKREVIDQLGYGTNAKLIGGFSERVWQTKYGASGSIISDNGLQTAWDTSRGQPGKGGVVTNFVGGKRGVSCGAGSAEQQYRSILPALDQIFPGCTQAYHSNSAVRMHWPSAPHALGSYACYLTGQWRFSGTEGARVGNLHFCGEHCSIDFQGFMEGACETGARVADEILADLGLHARPVGQLLPPLRKARVAA